LIFPTGLEATVLDFYEQVYSRPLVADQFSEPLVRLNKNFELLPAAASSWSGSEDGKTWTFILEPDRVWSDGNPVTANDWVATFRYAADPTHAWDCTWYFQNVLKGWNDAIAGKIPLDQLGVRQGADPYTLIFETEVPAPFLPAMLLYSAPLSAAGWRRPVRSTTSTRRRDHLRSVQAHRLGQGPADRPTKRTRLQGEAGRPGQQGRAQDRRPQDLVHVVRQQRSRLHGEAGAGRTQADAGRSRKGEADLLRRR
jgi:hypothetical protein